jgi:hypothetical protein
VSFLGFLNQWFNLPFLVMLGLVAVFFVLQVLGILGGSSDAEADVDHDVDVDVDADAEADVDHDVDHDADADGGAHAGWSEVLAFLGVGRVPFMVVWMTLCIFTGFAGLFANRLMFLGAQGRYPGWFFAVSLFLALAVGLVGVRLCSRLVFRFVDVGGKGSTTKHDLVGTLGVVASARVDETFGEVRVHDEQGTELMIHGRVQVGDKPLVRGQSVVLVEYDPQKELFWVASTPDVDQKA